MFGKISIIGCGLIGSSILRATQEKKLATKISVYDKSNKVIEYLKKILQLIFVLMCLRLSKRCRSDNNFCTIKQLQRNFAFYKIKLKGRIYSY